MLAAAVIIMLACCFFVLSLLFGGDNEDSKNSKESKKNYGIIFLDPGHGGVDSGTDAGGRYEKDDALKLSLAIRDCLEAEGYKVLMSRTEDVDIDREERGRMANEAGADFFISIHRNQASEGDGAEIWVPKENTEDQQILGNTLMEAFVECGFAERSVTPGVYKNPNDDYYENSIPNMPSCLAEVGFTSSTKDNEIFDRIDQNAKIIAESIIKAHKKVYPDRYTE